MCCVHGPNLVEKEKSKMYNLIDRETIIVEILSLGLCPLYESCSKSKPIVKLMTMIIMCALKIRCKVTVEIFKATMQKGKFGITSYTNGTPKNTHMLGADMAGLSLP